MNAKHEWADEIIALAMGFPVEARHGGGWFTLQQSHGFGAFDVPGFEFRIKQVELEAA